MRRAAALWQDRGLPLLLIKWPIWLPMLKSCPVRVALIQYLTRAGTPEVERLIGWLVTTNALTIVMLRVPLLHLTAGLIHAAGCNPGGALRRPSCSLCWGYRHLVALDSGQDPS